MNFKTICIGATASLVMTSGAVLSSAPSHALSLTGTLTLQGSATVPDYTSVGETQSITFSSPSIVTGTLNGDPITSGGITINPLALKLDSQTPGLSGVINRKFSNSGLVPFIDFGSRTIDGIVGNLSFNLNPSDDYLGTKTTDNGLLSIFSGGPLLGNFIFNGSSITSGTLSTNRSGGLASNGIYGITLTAEPIPTPALLPGLIGLGAAAIRRRKAAMAEQAGAEA